MIYYIFIIFSKYNDFTTKLLFPIEVDKLLVYSSFVEFSSVTKFI